jgi:hypothetical protein
MINTDNMASELITFLQALDDDHRLKELDRQFLTFYSNKLGSNPTTFSEDTKMLGILQRFFTYTNIKNST